MCKGSVSAGTSEKNFSGGSLMKTYLGVSIGVMSTTGVGAGRLAAGSFFDSPSAIKLWTSSKDRFLPTHRTSKYDDAIVRAWQPRTAATRAPIGIFYDEVSKYFKKIN